MNNFENLHKPFNIGKLSIKNRFCVAPMATTENPAEFTKEAIEYFVRRAKGGFGLIFHGATMADLEVDDFSQFGNFTFSPMLYRQSAIELNERIQSYGAHMFIQVSMGLGRNMPGMYAPSEIPTYGAPDQLTKALTKEQIKRKIELVIERAAFMKACGFSGVEVHSIHWGYLLDQFAMSLTNHRTDEYGGTLENRLRAAKEIVEGIKQVCGSDYPVTMRLGLQTYIKNFQQATLTGEEEAGRTLEEGLKIAKLLETYGYDALNVDTGTYDSFYYACPPMYMPKGYMVDLSEKAKQAVNIPILAAGRMNDPFIAEQAIKEGKMDAVVLGRAALADPDFPQKVFMGKIEKIRPCIACNQGCLHRLNTGLQPSCAVNPAAGKELTYDLERALQPKKVTVIGGGVAGMELARAATLRGHSVSLYEQASSLGGHLIPGGEHQFKKEVRELNDWYEQELNDLKVDIHLGVKMTSEKIKELGSDVVVMAVGSTVIKPKIPGIDHPKVLYSVEALNNKSAVGNKVVIVGGGLVGCEMALEYLYEGKDVTIVEALDSILSSGEAVPAPNKQMLEDLFEHYHTDIKTGHKLMAVEDSGAVIAPANGGPQETLEADTVIIAVGFAPRPSMVAELNGTGIEVYQIGDGRQVANVQRAIWEAYEVAREI